MSSVNRDADTCEPALEPLLERPLAPSGLDGGRSRLRSENAPCSITGVRAGLGRKFGIPLPRRPAAGDEGLPGPP